MRGDIFMMFYILCLVYFTMVPLCEGRLRVTGHIICSFLVVFLCFAAFPYGLGIQKDRLSTVPEDIMCVHMTSPNGLPFIML